MAVKDSWKQGKRETIVNCWKKVGFIAPLPTSKPDHPDQVGDEPMPNQDKDDAPSEITEREVVFRNIWDRLTTVQYYKWNFQTSAITLRYTRVIPKW